MSARRRAEPLPLGTEDGLPYSKGLMARALVGTGLPSERAYEFARRIEADLLERGRRSVTLDRLGELAVEQLGAETGAETVRRLHRYRDLQELDVPLIVLVGGATGSGKSTVATDVAYRLGITRVTSTDFVRQTLRAFFTTEFMPSVHYSSFDAGRAVADAEDPTLTGFLEQTENVLVGVAAAIERALHEGLSMVIEGVHLVPGLLPSTIDGALVAQCVLAIEDEDLHAGHFWIRDAASEGLRPLDRYLSRFGEIRRIQTFLVERAHEHGVPVVANENVEAAISTVMEIVLARVERAKEGA